MREKIKMNKLLVCMLLGSTLLLTACGVRKENIKESVSEAEITSEETAVTEATESIEGVGEGFSDDYANLIVHADDEAPLSDEELAELDDDYFEPENAENIEGAEEVARLAEEYGFYVIGLESVSELTYLDYESIYHNIYGLLRNEDYPIADVTILLQTVDSWDAGVKFIIVPTGFDEDYDLELSYQYGYGVMNISPLTISNQEPYWKQYASTY